MANSLRILASGRRKLPVMQAALRVIVEKTTPLSLSRGIYLAGKSGKQVIFAFFETLKKIFGSRLLELAGCLSSTHGQLISGKSQILSLIQRDLYLF